jgi:hypothetical protein
MKTGFARLIVTCRLAIGAASILALPSAAESQSATTASLPYETLLGQLAIFENIPIQQRDHILGGVVIKHHDPDDHTPIHLWVMEGARRIGIPLSAENVLFGPVRQDWIAGHVIVQTDQPKGTLAFEGGIWLAVPSQMPISLAYLHEGMRQTNAAIGIVARAIGGYLAQFAAPRVHHLTITLAGCCAGTALVDIAGSKSVLHQDPKGTIALPDAALADTAQGWLTPSTAVTKLDPE